MSIIEKVSNLAQRVTGHLVSLSDQPTEVEQERKKLDKYSFRQASIAVAVTLFVILGNKWISPMVGIITGSVSATVGFLFFLNSSRYIRDTWTLEKELITTTDKKKRSQLTYKLSIKRGYGDVDRNKGMACLTLSGGIFGLTVLMKLVFNL